MKKKTLLLATGSLFIWTVLCAQDVINNRYSDDILFGKQALDRIIQGNGTNIKKTDILKEVSLPVNQLDQQKNQQEIQNLDGLMGALDELEIALQPQVVEKKPEELAAQDPKLDTRHAITIIKHVAELEPLAQRLFEEALPLVKNEVTVIYGATLEMQRQRFGARI